MLHLGIVYTYNISSGNGIVMDSSKKIHLFWNDSNKCKIDTFSFVTYKGESIFVSNVTPLNAYKNKGLCSHIIHDPMSFCESSDFGFFITDNEATYSLNGADKFIISQFVKYKELKFYSDTNSHSSVQSILNILDKVNYVSSHIAEIALSYKVNIEVTHISKIGGDDRFYTERKVSLLYRDSYINKFFSSDQLLDKSSGYSSNYDCPYKEGEDKEMEEQDKLNFVKNYSKNEHLTELLKEYFTQEQANIAEITKQNMPFYVYWGIISKDQVFFNDSCLKICIEYIQKTNNPILTEEDLKKEDNKELYNYMYLFNNNIVTEDTWRRIVFDT